ncbi:MAG: efflux RND transporter periplasmic adaptor subunit [Thermoanaerobaculia bacterium]|nr:efflux RND transporter periplasmic adaptor subunit [Thermoanaerobaculia bacterium]
MKGRGPLVTLIAVAALSCATQETAPLSEGSTTPAVRRGHLASRQLLSGELVAEDAAVAVAPVVRIWPLQVRWIAEDGIQVEEGDRIMEFDNAQLASNLEDQNSAIVEAESRLQQVTAQSASDESAARLEVEKQRAAVAKALLQAELPEGLTSAKELATRRKSLEEAELQLAQAQTTLEARREGGAASVDATRLALDGARRELAHTEASLERLVLRSPRSGVLVLSDSDEGRAMREGDQVWPGRTVARIPDLDSLIVVANLYDVDEGTVAPGLRVRASLDAFPDEVLSGIVRRVEQIAQPLNSTSDRRAFKVLIDVQGLDSDRMRHGMSVKVEVLSPSSEEALLVPRGDLTWDQGQVLLHLAGGRSTAVTLGDCDNQSCVVLDDSDSEVIQASAASPGGGGT